MYEPLAGCDLSEAITEGGVKQYLRKKLHIFVKSCEALDAKRINNRVVEGIARNLRIASTTPPTPASEKTRINQTLGNKARREILPFQLTIVGILQ